MAITAVYLDFDFVLEQFHLIYNADNVYIYEQQN